MAMRAGSTLPSHPRHHWRFQLMSFIRLLTNRNAKGRHTPAFRCRPATYCSSVVVLLALEPQQVRFRPAGEVLDPDHHHAERWRGGELGRIDRQRHRGAGARPHHGERTDRKSTRLNSSHRCISYAVFCLKKKKKKETDVIQRDLTAQDEQLRDCI